MVERELGVAELPSVERRDAGVHLPALDGLRGMAIVMVLLHHFTEGPLPGNVVGRGVLKALWFGWMGVDLFFVLSGFLITGILLEAKAGIRKTENRKRQTENGEPAGKRPSAMGGDGAWGYYKNFYIRRVLRIFPLYYAVLALVFFVIPGVLQALGGMNRQWAMTEENVRWMHNAQHYQGWLWLYGANILESMGQGGFLQCSFFNATHFWSLAVEEHFYMIWPTVVLLSSRKGLVRICVGCCVGALVLRMVFLMGWLPAEMLPGGWNAEVAVYQFTLCRIDAMALGAMLAVLVRGTGGLRVLVRPARWVMGVAGVLGVVVLLRPRGEGMGNAAAEAAKFLLIGLVFLGLLVQVLASGKGTMTSRVFTFGGLRFFGKYSYGIYVFHALFLPVMYGSMIGPESLTRWSGSEVVGRVGYLVIASALSVGMALVSWNLWEKHFLKLKKYFEYRTSATTT